MNFASVDTDSIINFTYVFMHLVIVYFLVMWLKKKQITLAVLLVAIMSFLMYDNFNKSYSLYIPLIGLFIFFSGLHIKDDVNPIINAMWQIPYWSIIGYYVIILSGYLGN